MTIITIEDFFKEVEKNEQVLSVLLQSAQQRCREAAREEQFLNGRTLVVYFSFRFKQQPQATEKARVDYHKLLLVFQKQTHQNSIQNDPGDLYCLLCSDAI